MKKLLQIVCFVLAVTLSGVEGQAQTNVYHPFPEDTAVWISDHSSPQGYDYSNKYTLQGDTIIGTISYNKLYLQVVHFHYINPPPTPIVGFTLIGNVQYMGGIRQDSINKKVFFRGASMPQDTLLYDYDLAMGDTVPKSYMMEPGSGPWIVTGYDSILLSGKYHKIFLLNNRPPYPGNSYLIEGAGNSWDLLYMEEYFFEYGYDAACFNGDVITAAAFQGECGPNVLSVQETMASDLTFNISPNPTAGIITLSSSEDFSQLVITDVLGNQVYASRASTSYSTPLGMTIDLSAQPRGVYFIKVMDEKGNFGVRKIILE